MSVTVSDLGTRLDGTYRVKSYKFLRSGGAQSAAFKIGERIAFARAFVENGTVFDTRGTSSTGITMTEAADGTTSITIGTPSIAADGDACILELWIGPDLAGSHPTVASGL